MAEKLISVYVHVISMHCCVMSQNFTNDYKISKAQLKPAFQAFAEKLLAVSEDVPRPCRKDFCYRNQSIDDFKGEMFWPEIRASHKVELRCPFSVVMPVYATKVCGINDLGMVQWEDSNFLEVCPGRPLTELIKEIMKEINAAKMNSNFNDSANKHMYLSILRRMTQVIEDYRDISLYFDTMDIHYIISEALPPLIANNNGTIPLQAAKDIFFLINKLLEDDYKTHFFMPHKDFELIVGTLPYKIQRHERESLTLIYPNIALYIVNVNSDTPVMVNITEVFKVTDNLAIGDYIRTPNVSLDLTQVNKSSGPFDIAVTLFKEGTIIKEWSTWQWFRKEYMEVYDYANSNENAVTSSETGTEWYGKTTLTEWNYKNTLLFNTKSTETTTIIAESGTSYSNTSKPIPDLSTVNIEKVHHFDVAGSTIFLTSSAPIGIVDNILITFEIFPLCPQYFKWDNCTTERVCVKGSTVDHHKIWNSGGDSCKQLTSSSDDDLTVCSCRGLGSFGVFFQTSKYKKSEPLPETPIPVTMKMGDISSFFNFSFQMELEIIGNTLGVMSLVCLLLTVMSYAMFRHARKGAPTTILLNLCIALICLSCLLLGIHVTKESITMEGCIIVNTLRYYLVFVSLCWNGVEAFNMYLMIVRVFNSDISKFGVKAGIFAWGIPLAMVGTCFAFSVKSFNGQHVLVSAENGKCVYKCSLSERTLYYGSMVPMGLIISHNFVVFAFVLKAIFKHGSQLEKDQKKVRLVQLIGAVATLVLLGVPWMFSPFGIIDDTKNKHWNITKVAFQVIFVISVNIQGLFIFLFHCARNAEIRQSWSSAVKESSIKRQLSLPCYNSRQTKEHRSSMYKDTKKYNSKQTKMIQNTEI